jgi:ribosomal protein S16
MVRAKKRPVTLNLTEEVIQKVEADGANSSATVQRILDAYYGADVPRELVDEMLRILAAKAQRKEATP